MPFFSFFLFCISGFQLKIILPWFSWLTAASPENSLRVPSVRSQWHIFFNIRSRVLRLRTLIGPFYSPSNIKCCHRLPLTQVDTVGETVFSADFKANILNHHAEWSSGILSSILFVLFYRIIFALNLQWKYLSWLLNTAACSQFHWIWKKKENVDLMTHT